MGDQKTSGQSVQRTSRPKRAALHHVRVDHGRAYVGVAEKLLNRSDVRTCLKQVRGKAVAEHVARDRLADTRPPPACLTAR